MGVLLVEPEFRPRPYGLGEVRGLGLGVGKSGRLLQDVRNLRPEPSEELSSGAFEERSVDVAVFAVEDDFASVGIFQADAPPAAAGVGVLLGRVRDDLDRAVDQDATPRA